MKSNKKTITDYEMLEALIQNIPDSVYFKDSQSRFIKVNKSIVNRLKASDELEVIGKTDFDFFTKAHAEKAFNDEQKIIKIGIPVVNKEEKETWENGLYNHRYIVDLIVRFTEESKRYNQRLSIAMIDIDNFKSLNDIYGHPFGDEVLIKLSSIFEEKIRKTDAVGRYGGEEFLIVLKHAGISGAVEVVERIRSSVENLKWNHKDVKITISVGVCERNDEDNYLLISKADQLLLKAKKNGKNRIEC